MHDLANALWIEWRKLVRSKAPVFMMAGFFILPLACAFMMFIYKNPDFARQIGLLSVKANLAGGSADWPFFLNMYSQGVAIGGLLIYSLAVSWIFGREFSDGTLKDLLAVPVARGALLVAKFIIASLWSLVLTLATYLAALALGALVGLPLGTPELFAQTTRAVGVIAILVILDIFPVAFFASVGRGYLAPVGALMFFLVMANIVALLGWGAYFPWSIPGLYAGMTGKAGTLGAESYIIVVLTGLAGIGATYLWWKYADQNR